VDILTGWAEAWANHIRSLRPSPAPPQCGQRDRCTHGMLLGECCYQRD
jgi:hypothetical protein